jgi:hypothetical protein
MCFDEGEGGQVTDLAHVEVGLEREHELVERLVVGQAQSDCKVS